MIGGKEITMKGSILRKEKATSSYAVQFTEVPMDEKLLLKKFIDASIEKIKDSL